MAKRLFTSESVTEGHPDKVCDQISDAVLDDILAHDPNAHVACETFTTTGIVTVMGEITTKHYTDIPSIVRRTVERIGYTDPAYGFDYRSCAVMTAIDEQSPDIAMGVNESFELQEGGTDEADRIGAGDQGMMFGYACDETDVLMPAPIDLAHKLARQLTDVRKSGKLSWLRPDGKSQVTVEYGDDGKVLSCPAIVVSTQHDPDIALKDLREAVVEEIIKPIIPAHYITKDTKFYVNPTGRFVVGGPVGDTGLTGRKIIVDTYGGSAAHGGGCFSGKDPTKVDRSAAYMARYIAKNLVAAGVADEVLVELSYAIGIAQPLSIYVDTYRSPRPAALEGMTDGEIARRCRKCQIELAYAIGVAHPVSVLVDTYGTGVLDEEKLSAIVNECFDMRPAKIIEHLDLRRPIYEQTAAYGHFGRTDVDLPWEHTDMVEKLKSYL